MKHLAFDVYHFRAYVRLCRDRSLWMCAPILVQAVLYALLLHMRILLNFFGARPKHDDIGVGHFLRYPRIKMTFASGLLTPTDRARDAVIHLSQRLVHLTAPRWEAEAPTWNEYEEHFGEIDGLIAHFEAGLPDDVREVFLAKLSDWETAHPAAVATISASPPRGRAAAP